MNKEEFTERLKKAVEGKTSVISTREAILNEFSNSDIKISTASLNGGGAKSFFKEKLNVKQSYINKNIRTRDFISHNIYNRHIYGEDIINIRILESSLIGHDEVSYYTAVVELYARVTTRLRRLIQEDNKNR